MFINPEKVNSGSVAKVCLALAENIHRDGGVPVCFAAVDSVGELIYLHRMDGAPERLINIAIGKAYTAARMRVSTTAFKQRLIDEQLSLADFLDVKFTSLPGGQPLFDNKQLIGGIGVSGRTLEEDRVLCLQLVDSILS
ncbi:GlcG/HbpS family heme-binding protein [Photobacterium minamisatsumaniensis]|uniref:GlcG/HbpS family heme-binding protein n=1 Tax=Photobacterium minamisatsumaniensis TaxID=2910233 RepID=UPI003D0D6EB9